MTEGTPWKHILRFGLPLLLGMFLQQLYNTTDTLIVGNFIGTKALSAVGTTNNLGFLFLAIRLYYIIWCISSMASNREADCILDESDPTGFPYVKSQ